MKSSLGVLLSLCIVQAGCQNDSTTPSKVAVTNWPGSLVSPAPPPPALRSSHPRFVLYQTDNIFTLLLLDTQTGRLWQAQYAISEKSFRGTVPVSLETLAQGKNGRFALTKTGNM